MVYRCPSFSRYFLLYQAFRLASFISIICLLLVEKSTQLLHHRHRRITGRANLMMRSSSSPSSSSAMAQDGEEKAGPMWDPVAQIYVGGVVPENAAVKQMIEDNQGSLRIFGYGSLCWNPGQPGTAPLADPAVEHCLGRAVGYRRCWAQKSTDHRGRPGFPGLVCTLLTEEEFRQFRTTTDGKHNKVEEEEEEEEAMTEGLIYVVPPQLVKECLAELDFREKGGYARDVIDVVEDVSGNTVRALLYRGTPENPAFWPRALRDLPFAAAIMSVASGPSGENNFYLNQLDLFLEDAAEPASLAKFDDTFQLNTMVNTLKTNYELYFMVGCGSNQHNQLLLHNRYAENIMDNAAGLENGGEDAHEFKEIVLCAEVGPETNGGDKPVEVYAGGGHSGVLTESGRLFLFGWNEYNQLGTSGIADTQQRPPLPVVQALSGMKIETAALGFSHSLVIEEKTRRLYAFGDNSRGQVTGTQSTTPESKPITPTCIQEDARFVRVAAGLFHSAAITEEGELLTFGCGRHGQCLASDSNNNGKSMQWKPPDNSHVVDVACGRRHTVILDDRGRVWTLGNDNKYGQLGRSVAGSLPVQVTCQEWEDKKLEAFDVQCGWSHTVMLARNKKDGSVLAYGWGRNDKGQLGKIITENSPIVHAPSRIFDSPAVKLRSISCGSESTYVIVGADGDARDETIWSCGWNEHGNLNTGKCQDAVVQFTKMQQGAPLMTAPGYASSSKPFSNIKTAIAAGGAHLLAMKVVVPET